MTGYSASRTGESGNSSSVKGQIDDLVEEIQKTIDRGERVLVPPSEKWRRPDGLFRGDGISSLSHSDIETLDGRDSQRSAGR